MTVNLANSLVQESKSCPVAITGISCLLTTGEDLKTFWQNLFCSNDQSLSNASSVDNNTKDDLSILSKLAVAALADAEMAQDSPFAKKASIIIGDCYHINSDSRTFENQNLDCAAQLRSILGWSEHGENIVSHIESPLQGLSLAAEKLYSGESDAILLFLIERGSPDRNIQSATAFVLRRVADLDLEKERSYASLIIAYHEQEKSVVGMDDKNERYKALKTVYQKAKIQMRSIDLLAIGTQSSVWTKADFANFAQCFAESDSEDGKDRKQGWCCIRETNFVEDSNLKSRLVPLLETILSLQQKVFLPTRSMSSLAKVDSLPRPFYFNGSLRPWLCPQIHAQFTEISPPVTDYSSSSNLRRAALHYIDQAGNFSHFLLEECKDKNEAKGTDLNPQWDSELFTFFAGSRQELLQYIELFEGYLISNGHLNLKDLAFTINSWTKRRIDRALS